MADFVANREALPVRMVERVDADDRRAVADIDHAGEFVVERRKTLRMKWQAAVPALRRGDVIFGCVDSYRERDELERFARRFLIPYIDLGMDVHRMDDGYSIGGQSVLSSPGGPCLWCLGILTEERITRQAGEYGQAGSQPQVVWANGVLASLAVGLFVQLVCPWHGAPQASACCEFDGNRHRVETNRLDHIGAIRCRHFNDGDLGDAFFNRGTDVECL
jgi:molybdopterin-synthase adenylyltransferase